MVKMAINISSGRSICHDPFVPCVNLSTSDRIGTATISVAEKPWTFKLKSDSMVCPAVSRPENFYVTSKRGTTIASVGKITGGQNHHDEEITTANEQPLVTEEFMEALYVHWFREASPYIQGFRSNVFVIVLPGEVTVDNFKMDGILKDILLLHGLGVKLVLIPGTHVQIDQLLRERGLVPQYFGAYRVTDENALAASMEAAGKVRVAIEAKLSQGPSIPILRRHGDNDRRHEVSIASGNFLAAKRRGVVDGVDFGATGEVKRIDVSRIQERLDDNCIVMLTNLGYSLTGEVLNCNTYEVATACAIALQADKMLCLLDGSVLDADHQLIRTMSLQEADILIRENASQSSAAAVYSNAVIGAISFSKSGLSTYAKSADHTNGTVGVRNNKIGTDGGSILKSGQRTSATGFAIGGDDRTYQTSYLNCISELTAAVFVCKNGVRRVHLLDSNIQGVLLLELYSRDGIGTMVFSDMYEGARPASLEDITNIMELLRPLEESGILVNRTRQQLEEEFQYFSVVERDGSILACAALFPYNDDKCGELAAFAVSPGCRGQGQGDALLDYIEKLAGEMNLKRLFLLTTRTADWFVHRGFSACTLDRIPQSRREKIDYKRGAKYYEKTLRRKTTYLSSRRQES